MSGGSGDQAVAIVGAGPWGTYALERLAARAAALIAADVRTVVVFDTAGSFGDGRIHSADQVSTSRLNRVASQVGFAADEAVTDAPLLPLELRPTLAQWSANRDSGITAVPPTETPARSVHGKALRAAFRRYEAHLRQAGIAVERVHGTVVGVHPDRQGISLRYVGAGQSLQWRASAVLLTTGHGAGRASDTGVALSGPYPLAFGVTEAGVPPDSVVALDGAGLTAVDVLIHLTEGRGGRFVDSSRGINYISSGREPSRILPVSPSGLLPAARPRNHKATDASGRGHSALELSPRWFRTATIDRLARHRHRLDFDHDVLPFAVAEMALTYYRVLAGDDHAEHLTRSGQKYVVRALADGEPLRLEDLLSQLHEAFAGVWTGREVQARVRSILDPLPSPPWWRETEPTPALLRFDWSTIADPLGTSRHRHSRWPAEVLAQMRWDLACAEQGNLDNPWKAAWDGVWRDLRPLLSRVLDFELLTSESKQAFLRTHWRTYARQVNGADPATIAKIIALIEAGVVDMSAGRGAQVVNDGEGTPLIARPATDDIAVDVVVPGRVPRPDLLTEPPYAQLLREGLLNVSQPADGASIMSLSRDFHPLSSTGDQEPRITILGPPTEGLVFFQLALARPYSASSVVRALEDWAAELVSKVLDSRTQPDG